MRELTCKRIAEGSNQFRSTFDEDGEMVGTSTLSDNSHPFDAGLEGEPFQNGHFCRGGKSTLSFIIPQWRTNQKWRFNSVLAVDSDWAFFEILPAKLK